MDIGEWSICGGGRLEVLLYKQNKWHDTFFKERLLDSNPWSSQNIDLKIDIYPFLARHSALLGKGKDSVA